MGRPRKYENPQAISFKLEKEEVEALDEVIEALKLPNRSMLLRKFARKVISKKETNVSITNQNANFNLNINMQQQKQQQIQNQSMIIQWMLNIVVSDLEKIRSIVVEGLHAEEQIDSKLAEFKAKQVQENKLQETKEKIDELLERIQEREDFHV